jgi:5-hydroxyisourate hydrolase
MGLSTHVLDTTLGKPAPGIALVLSRHNGSAWMELGQGATDADGRCKTLLGNQSLQTGMHRLLFVTEPWFAAQQLASLYPFVEITFTIRHPEQHHHIPLLISANGYTTYRGS